MESPTDETLVRRFSDTGEDRHFLTLIDRYIDRLRRMLHLVVGGSAEDREDAEQEILASLYFDIGKFRFQSAFATYFYRYCRNKAVDIVRKNQRERRRRSALKLHAITVAAESGSPETQALERERASEMLSAVRKLDVDDRTLIHLKEVEGLTIADIARIMNVAEGTVKSRLHRARNRVVQLLREAEGSRLRPPITMRNREDAL